MTYEFKAGETYRTKAGEAVIFGEVHGNLIGYVWQAHLPKPTRWRTDGYVFGMSTAYDLIPPKRQIWIAVWRCPSGRIETYPYGSEDLAEKMASHAATRIAVLGPIDVEDAP